ncbi:TlpA family protein disulfide reductase [Sphingomonas sp. HDW15A]|uniref:TlpA family protein disulfide reductase n=1 Tax=Sphingomonas sp. HDW15A TaxID=2714942 RepID=UPI001409C7DF|nr:TlpA disulfide reductase family protein [Sphingomonas sp. HDW15A]QIK95790.1 TlpA family protein disulfide reductase [Sphingomonas sp. HDW15A]
MRSLILAGAIALALALPSKVSAASVKIGKPAPDTTMHLVDGSSVKLSELRGQVVVLNYWATWCVPCRVELPMLDKYYRIQGKHGLKVYAVATEDSLPTSKLKPLFNALAIAPVRKIGGSYKNFDAVPTNIVIDRAGVVRYAKSGAFDLQDMNEIIVPLLKEPAPTAP